MTNYVDVKAPCGHKFRGSEIDDLCEQIVLARGFAVAMASIEGAAMRIAAREGGGPMAEAINRYWKKHSQG